MQESSAFKTQAEREPQEIRTHSRRWGAAPPSGKGSAGLRGAHPHRSLPHGPTRFFLSLNAKPVWTGKRRPQRTGACAPRPEPPDRLGRPDPHNTSPLQPPKSTQYFPATPQPRNPRFRRPTRGRPQAAKPAAQTRPPLPQA